MLADQLRQDVLHRHNAGRAAKFIEHNGHAALLFLQRPEKLQQVHRLGHEGRKFNGIRQFDTAD